MAGTYVGVNLSSNCYLKGKREAHPGCVRRVCTFKGVPYAAPPIGDRRFKPTEPLQLWEGGRDAIKYGTLAPQPKSFEDFKAMLPTMPMPEDQDNMGEDCLYLNIYTPTVTPKSPMPVMVFLHGGGFFIGCGEQYPGYRFCDEHDVVIVTINYRLGVFGALTTGDDVMPGCYGIYDQIEALKWIQKYISLFGGNPDNVTLFGQSAGSGCVDYLIYTEKARGLFHRAILQSGHAASGGVDLSKEEITKLHLAAVKGLGCESTDSADIRRFLMTKDTDTIQNGVDPQNARFCPYVDGDLMPDKPQNLMAQRKALPVDVLMGKTSHEGAMFYAGSRNAPGMEGPMTKKKFKEIVEGCMKMFFTDKSNYKEITDMVVEEFAGPSVPEDSETLDKALVDIHGQSFLSGLHDCAQGTNVNNNTYYYYFTHRPSFCIAQEEWMGASHGDELAFQFWDDEVEGFALTEEEKALGKRLRSIWVNFARDGCPSAEGQPKWSTYTKDHPNYMEISTNECTPKTGFLDLEKEEFFKKIKSKMVFTE